jgi:hypothetical protein
MGKFKRNDPCICGSGKKYKDCCYKKMYHEIPADKKIVNFTLEDRSKTLKQITSIDSIPKYNVNGLTPDITDEQMMDLCLDEIYSIILTAKVGMLLDLVDKVVNDMDIVPTFTYRQISERMNNDGRFEIFQSQICSLKGTDPVELIEGKLRQ